MGDPNEKRLLPFPSAKDLSRQYNSGTSSQGLESTKRRSAHTAMTPDPSAEQVFQLRSKDNVDERKYRGRLDSSDEEEAMYTGEKRSGSPSKESRGRHYDSRLQLPLVKNIRNEWQTNPKYKADDSPTDGQDAGIPDCINFINLRVLGYVLLAYVMLFLLLITLWSMGLGNKVNEYQQLGISLKSRIKTGKGWFGTNMTPVFADMIQVQTLDASHTPSDRHLSKRLIIVGDVHGCYEEFTSLLEKVSFSSKTDHIILTGDMISKGPSSPAVLDLAISLNASCVRGNYEDRILLTHKHMAAHRLLSERKSDPNVRTTSRSFSDRRLASSLSPAQIEYIASCPVILSIPELPTIGSVAVVHAGLVPGVKLKHQDPNNVMTMRSIDLKTHVPSQDGSAGSAWTKLWNKYQKMISEEHRLTVIYGHDSKRGVVREKWSWGIDGGCVTGGELVGLVIEREKMKNLGIRLESVQCKDYREKDL